MNTLRQAVQEYLSMRRNLGFQLRETGKGLMRFRDLHGAAPRVLYYRGVGTGLGAATGEGSTLTVGTTTELCPRICSSSQRNRSTDADSAARLAAVPAETGATVSVLR